MNVTLTLAGPLATACSIYKAMTGQAQTGVTVTPAKFPLTTSQSGRGACQTLSIQNDPTNAAGTYVYEGDGTVLGDGTCQGATIALGATYIKTTSDKNAVPLIDIFVNASGAAKVNIDVNFV
jgi:hypothetical protein